MKEIEKINTWIDCELAITDTDGYEYLCEDSTKIEQAIIRHINIERDSDELLQNNDYSFELLNEIDTEYCVELLNQIIEMKMRMSLEFTEII